MEYINIIDNGISKSERGNQVAVESFISITKAIEYINEHYTNPLSLSEMFKYATMSRTAFAIKFKQVTGETFVAYVHLLRIRLAKKLLQENEYKITQIGKLCGFESTSYFCKIFLKYTGMTPGAYIAVQKENKKEEDSARSINLCCLYLPNCKTE